MEKSGYSDPRPLIERPLADPFEGGAERPVAGRKAGQGAGARRSVTVNLAESPLTWLHARGHLSDRQLDAGEKLRADYERAQLGPSITMSWSPAPMAKGRRGAPDHLDATERQMVARQRFDAALAALGRDLSHIAWRVICAGEGVPVAEKALGWPVRSGKLVLRIALDRLADHYRLPG